MIDYTQSSQHPDFPPGTRARLSEYGTGVNAGREVIILGAWDAENIKAGEEVNLGHHFVRPGHIVGVFLDTGAITSGPVSLLTKIENKAQA